MMQKQNVSLDWEVSNMEMENRGRQSVYRNVKSLEPNASSIVGASVEPNASSIVAALQTCGWLIG